MNVVLAKSAGFCFGVKRAVNMVYEEVEASEEPIYTYGPIIHNDEVVKDLGSNYKKADFEVGVKIRKGKKVFHKAILG